MRPSGRPLETSRCLRSPVEAGSIPYSAVTQPRPLPCIHFGTFSSTDAVQITRVPPIDISAEPDAVDTKPGSIRTSRRSPGARPSWRLTPPPPRPARPARGPRARSAAAGSGCPGAGTPRGRPRRGSGRRPGAASGAAIPSRSSSSATSSAIASPEVTISHAPAHRALDQRTHERVVGAAEDHRVHLGLAQRRARLLDALDRALVHLAAGLDQRRERRARPPRAAGALPPEASSSARA